MADMKTRNLKVYEQSGYKYKATPAIMLKGQWLKDAGFEIGDYITVTVEDGKLIIAADAERAAIVEAEEKFMEQELKKLQKQFEADKAKIRAQFVAESNGAYGDKKEVQC